MMYLLSIKASKKKMADHGLSPEHFWEIVDLNLEDKGIVCLGGDETGHLYDGQHKLIALNTAFYFSDNGLQAYLYSMTDYTIYCIYKKSLEQNNSSMKLRKKDEKLLSELKSDEDTAKILNDEDVCFERCLSVLPTIIEWDKNECYKDKRFALLPTALGVESPKEFKYTPETHPEMFPEMKRGGKLIKLPKRKAQ